MQGGSSQPGSGRIYGATGRGLIGPASVQPSGYAGPFGTSESSAGKLSADFPLPVRLELVTAAELRFTGSMSLFYACPTPTRWTGTQGSRGRCESNRLSADFRLRNADVYEAWYKVKHTATDLLEQAVYGLPELYRNEFKETALVANPGCFPTSVILGLYRSPRPIC